MFNTSLSNKRLPCQPQPSLKPLALAISLLFLGAAHTAAYADAGITELVSFSGGSASDARGVNAAGDVVVGRVFISGSVTRAFRWTQATGMTNLGTLAGAPSSASTYANGVNAAGDVVVGSSGLGSNVYHAFRWTQAGTMTDLGTLGGSQSVARGVNAAGDVVVGYSGTNSGANHAFRWTLNSGSVTQGTMTDLGTLGGTYSYAYGVNAAGNVVVGYSYINGLDVHAFRWTLNSGSATQGTMADLGTLGGTYSYAQGVNAAGDVVVGYSVTGSGVQHAFRWTLNSGTMTDLGTLAADKTSGVSTAYAVNAAGNVVVGNAYTGSGTRAFRWTQATGMQTIEDWLAASGVTVNASAPKTQIAYGVNAAGNVVVGTLTNSHAYIAVAEKGLIDQVDNNKSLAGAAGTTSQAMQDASLVMHGAHGSPMRGLLSAGKQSFWTAGDWGQSDNQGNDGNLGAVEVGYARGLTKDVMVKFALGRTYSKQDTVFGGNTKVDGSYIMPEVIAKISGTPLYASFSGYYNWGDSDVTRGYDNAGTREFSRGSADTSTTALRARLDWLDAIKAGNTAFTPYTSVTYTRTKIDAYTETGGSFPANWNSRTEHSTDARLGLDAVHRVDDKLNLLGRLEGVHRFNNQGADAIGDVAGLYGFNLSGQTYKRNWLRAAVGLEGKMGAGTGSLMLNASTQSDSTSYWLAASYRMEF